MTPSLTFGELKIGSLVKGNTLVGVSRTKSAFQDVHLNGPVRTVSQVLVSIENARLCSSAVVGSQVRRP